MKKSILVLVLLVFSLSYVFSQQADVRHELATNHGPIIKDILRIVKPNQLEIRKKTRIKWEQVDKVCTRLLEEMHLSITELQIEFQKKEQGLNHQLPPGWEELLSCKIRYFELFPDVDNKLLFPLTQKIRSLAPSSSFAGIMARNKKGKEKSIMTGKRKKYHDSKSFWRKYHGSAFTVELLTYKGSLSGLAADAVTVRWGDIKNRIAFSLSSKKCRGDDEMKLNALLRSFLPPELID